MSFDTPFQTGERELSVKMNFFIEQGRNATNTEEPISGDDVHHMFRGRYENGVDA